ncbi:hypothetical protein ABLN64_08115 [Mycobacterium tuberculosis]
MRCFHAAAATRLRQAGYLLAAAGGMRFRRTAALFRHGRGYQAGQAGQAFHSEYLTLEAAGNAYAHAGGNAARSTRWTLSRTDPDAVTRR